MKKISIGICDDEKLWREQITELAAAYCKKNSFETDIIEYSQADEISDSNDNDILFLDIEIAGSSGIEIKNKMQESGAKTSIIFISSHPEMMPEAFGKNVIGFLNKPISAPDFECKMDLVMANIAKKNRTLIVENNGNLEAVPVEKVKYISADGKYSKIFVCGNDKYVFSDSNIGYWSDELKKEGFERGGRSVLVNMAYVKSIGHTGIVLKDDSKIELSRRLRKQFIESYREYIWKMSY